jgi:hypothetical protein
MVLHSNELLLRIRSKEFSRICYSSGASLGNFSAIVFLFLLDTSRNPFVRKGLTRSPWWHPREGMSV